MPVQRLNGIIRGFHGLVLERQGRAQLRPDRKGPRSLLLSMSRAGSSAVPMRSLVRWIEIAWAMAVRDPRE
jgi:hypothetical protein